jgi:multidrug resistance efflux pump
MRTVALAFVAVVWQPGGDRGKDAARADNELQKIVLARKGYLVPIRTMQVSPEVSGRVMQLHFEEGTQVKKGDLLAELDPRRYELEYRRAQAGVDQARAALEQQSRGSRQEEIKLAELNRLEAEEQRKLTQAELKQAERKTNPADAFEIMKANSRLRMAELQIQRAEIVLKSLREGPRPEDLAAARAQVAAAEAAFAAAKYLLDSTRIYAPFAGTILTKKVEVGSLVDPAGFQVSAGVCELADLNALEVDLPIEERDLSQIFQGQKCEIRSEAFPGVVYQGQVARLLPMADRAKGAVPVRVRLDRSKNDGKLRPEMGVLVTFFAKD